MNPKEGEEEDLAARKPIAPRVQQLGDFHSGPVMDIVSVQDGVVASVSPEKFPAQARSLLRMQRQHAAVVKLARRRGRLHSRLRLLLRRRSLG